MNWKQHIAYFLHSSNRFIRFVIEHFVKDECPYIASALAFTSLLAIVPLMSVGLAIFSSFPLFQSLVDPIQNFIFENFIPSSGKVVQSYLQQFASQMSKLSLWGLSFLVCTSLLMMFTIEQAMNKIWRTQTSRHGVAAFLLYWSILSLAPIILGLSLAASSYLFSLPTLFSQKSPSLFLSLFPFLLSLLGFTFLFVVVPNCPVKIRHAFWGGLFAAVLFEFAKNAFAYYLTRYNPYELLYGAFAVVPIFFIWVYWVWVITLLGAEISYAFSVHHQRREGKSLDGFSHALLWLHQLWLGQQQGNGLTYNELVDVSTQPFAVDVDEMINALIYNELIHATADGHYMLSRDLDYVTLYDLTQLLPYRLPTHLELDHSQSSLTEQWLKAFKKNNEDLQKSLDISLESFFKKCDDRAGK